MANWDVEAVLTALDDDFDDFEDETNEHFGYNLVGGCSHIGEFVIPAAGFLNIVGHASEYRFVITF